MIFGNVDKFGFIIERIPEWEDGYWFNGIMFVTVNGEIYPKEIRTTTFNSELPDVLGDDSAFAKPVCDVKLYNKSDLELFDYLQNIAFPTNIDVNNDYKYYIPFHEIGDSGYRFFCISNGENIKIFVGKDCKNTTKFIDKIIITIEEYEKIKFQLKEFSNSISLEQLFREFKFNESTNDDIKEINGMQLPSDYLEFMHKHNGGEGDVGKNSYIQLIKLEELTDYNNDYEISKHFPNCFAFGGDLGGNHFCYNFTTKEYFAIDCCTTGLEDSYCKASSLYEFIKNWDKQFEK